MITIPLLYRLLGVDEGLGLNRLVRAAYQVSYHLPVLVVSAAGQQGVELGPASSDLLRRARERADDYAVLYEVLAADTHVRQLKGHALAHRYPEGVTRPSGDLDLVAERHDDLWKAARLIIGRRPVSDVDLTFMGKNGEHTLLHLEWPAEDVLMDPLGQVDLCTAAYSERAKVLPLRSDMPESAWEACFLAVCEERFQRSFNAKDFIDVLVLRESAPPAGQVVDAVREWDFVPEAAELLDRAGGFFELGPLEDVRRALLPHLPADRGQRAVPRDFGDEPSDARERLNAGLPVFGLRLGEIQDRADRHEVKLHEFDGGVCALTPVGDYLLVGRQLVDPALYERAVTELAALDG
ncbi:hypothetical protein ACH4KU_33985 [Streptomyces althioticus]|uniref:hypothetical protein n=1 Tax=Streptomyces TaxID=1883 RepID=UPI0033E5E92F